jgi:hypothetical protein
MTLAADGHIKGTKVMRVSGNVRKENIRVSGAEG